MDINILRSTWRAGLIGFVAVDYAESGYWQAYIGIGKGINQDKDARDIAVWGEKLSWLEAAVFFPELDITKYKIVPKKEEAK